MAEKEKRLGGLVVSVELLAQLLCLREDIRITSVYQDAKRIGIDFAIFVEGDSLKLITHEGEERIFYNLNDLR